MCYLIIVTKCIIFFLGFSYREMSKKCKELLRIVHNDVALPDEGKTYFCKGDYEYWHYGCDGVNDQVKKVFFVFYC